MNWPREPLEGGHELPPCVSTYRSSVATIVRVIAVDHVEKGDPDVKASWLHVMIDDLEFG